MRINRVQTLLALIVTSLSLPVWAQNDCAAIVTPKSAIRIENTTVWRFEFSVRTSCEHSHGRFEYTFKAGGKTVERGSPSWTSTDGKNPTVVDEHNVGLREIDQNSVSVKPGSIQSTNTGT